MGERLSIKPMKRGFVLSILLLNFFFSAFMQVRAGEFEAPPASVNAEELRELRDRLSTSLFFKGELADLIMEAGLQDRLVKLTGRETRSEARLALLGWIRKDPDQAAKIYFYLKGRGPGAAAPPEAVSYAMPSWEINPHFLELIEGVNKAAKDAAMSEEELSLAAQRLFGGPQARPEDYTPWIPGADAGTRPFGPPPAPIAAIAGSSVPVPGPKGRGMAVNYAEYSLNPVRVERESRALGGWFENVKSAMEDELPAAGKEKRPAPGRRLFDETFAIYRNFVVALSGLKGRTKITREESVRLEALRRSLRKNLGELEALSVIRKLNKRAETLPADSPGAGALRADARRIEEVFKAFLAGLREDPENVSTAAGRLYELEKVFDFWTLRVSAHGRLADLKSRITNRGFSCVFDKLIFKYLSRFRPSAEYVRLEAAQALHAKAMEVSLEGVAAGDYETAAFFSGGEKRSLSVKIREAEAAASRLEAYSGFNRRIQFFFWDVLANPFGLAPGPGGICAGNKLAYP